MAKKSASPKGSPRKRSTSAPDAFRGFSLQATRFLFHLMKAAPDDVVSLEYFEDVGVEKADGVRIAEQDKSYLSGNPLSDRSVVFWKAIRNWLDGSCSGGNSCARLDSIRHLCAKGEDGSNRLCSANVKSVVFLRRFSAYSTTVDMSEGDHLICSALP